MADSRRVLAVLGLAGMATTGALYFLGRAEGAVVPGPTPGRPYLRIASGPLYNVARVTPPGP